MSRTRRDVALWTEDDPLVPRLLHVLARQAEEAPLLPLLRHVVEHPSWGDRG
jgi:hypothetical protein